MHKKTKIFLLSVLTFLFLIGPSLVLANAKEIAEECEQNSDCITDNCQESTRPDKKKFCTCKTDNDCNLKYPGILKPNESWSCIQGKGAFYNSDSACRLNYCRSGDIRKMPGGTCESSTGERLFDPTQSVKEIEGIINEPQTKIEIPGLKFTDAEELKKNAVEEYDGTYIKIPYFGEYLAAVYKYVVAVSSVIAVVLIMNHGFGWVISGGDKQKIDHAKKRIVQSVIGLLLAVGSYALLYTINPELVKFKNLKILFVQREEISDSLTHTDHDEEDHFSDTVSLTSGVPSGEKWTIPGTNIKVELSKRDLCFLENFGSTHEELNKNITTVNLFGSEIEVHKLIAQDLQERFDELNNSTNPKIIAWKKQLLDKEQNKCTWSGCQGPYYNPITDSGAFTPYGHGSDKALIKQYGKDYGISLGGGIGNTAGAAYIKHMLLKSGKVNYEDKNGVTRKLYKIKNWLSHGTHSFGLAFDIDYPRNPPYTKNPNIPKEAADIITKDGLFKWGFYYKTPDPSHFGYTGPICK